MEQLFKDAKVGDKVIAYGIGRSVICATDDDELAIGIKSGNGSDWFRVDGRKSIGYATPVCFPIDKAPQHLLDMFPEEKTFREYSSSRIAFGLFDTKTNNMVDIKETREEAEEAAKFFVSTVVVVECTVAVSFDMEVSA